MQILYLDYDGVLHPDSVFYERCRGVVLKGAPGHALFEHARILESILEPFPNVEVVLSTSWVPTLGFNRAKKYLPPGLQERVVGATFHGRYTYRNEFFHMSRGMQVLDDAARRRPMGWVAIDDDGEWWPDVHRHRLVLTDSSRGLGDERKQHELIQILRGLLTDNVGDEGTGRST